MHVVYPLLLPYEQVYFYDDMQEINLKYKPDYFFAGVLHEIFTPIQTDTADLSSDRPVNTLAHGSQCP